MPRVRDLNQPPNVAVMCRMQKVRVKELDVLCRVNNRSRTEILQILVHEAAMELKVDPNARVNP